MTVYEIVTLVAVIINVVVNMVLAILIITDRRALIKQETQRLIAIWNGLATAMKSNDCGGQNFSDAKEETDDL